MIHLVCFSIVQSKVQMPVAPAPTISIGSLEESFAKPLFTESIQQIEWR